ncbi:MAG: MBL fold metallo-hydrolase [Clostridiales bacterium]
MKNNWFEIEEITSGIYAIYDYEYSTNYLINGRKKSLLIDSGWGLSNIKEFAMQYTNKPIMLVNTHGHPDHVGGNSDFSEFYISKYDIDILKKCYSIKNKKWAIEKAIREFPENFSKDEWLEKKFNKIIPIDDGYKFDLGDRNIEVISIPGHSNGCIALLDEVSRCLFSGDSIFDGVWLHLEESTSIVQYKESLLKIEKIESKFDNILPGHSNKNLNKKLLNNLISLSNDINDKIVIGKSIKTLVGNGMKYNNNNCRIIGKVV